MPLRENSYPTCEVLLKYFKKHDIKTFVEVGVYYGDSAVYLMQRHKFDKYYMVDKWESKAFALERFSQEAMNKMYEIVLESSKNFPESTIIRLPSVEAAKEFEDNSVDCVYIDASHEQSAVYYDILAWNPKAKKILMGHDYDYGQVSKSVDRLLSKLNGFSVEYDVKGKGIWILEKK